MAVQTIHITLPDDGTDFEHWRNVARALLLRDMPPDAVAWQTAASLQSTPDLFSTMLRVQRKATRPCCPLN